MNDLKGDFVSILLKRYPNLQGGTHGMHILNSAGLAAVHSKSLLQKHSAPYSSSKKSKDSE